MKTKIYTLLAISALSLSSNVFAGEGGVAGSISYQISSSAVTNASAAVAVGKNTAYAGASSTAGGATDAFAAGSAGVMTPSGSSIYINSIASDLNADLGTAQSNTLSTGTINALDATGTLTQTAP